MPRSETAGARLLATWQRLAGLPGGRWLFARVIRWTIPYSGSIRPRFESLEAGHARVSVTQHRAIEQHLGSIHAIALANLAELASGAAVITALPFGYRGIVTRLTIDYVKKARGIVTADCAFHVSALGVDNDYDVVVTVVDQRGDAVARAAVRWKIGVVPPRSA